MSALLALGACSEPCPEAPGLGAQQCAEVRAMRLPEALPAARGNAHAEDPAAALLGFRVFFDARFSSDQQVRCATCHAPERHFQDGLPVAHGLEDVTRNTPTVLNAAWQRWQTWDGSADSLWSQPLTALENPKEMNLTRLELAHRIAEYYGPRYEPAFGALPPLGDTARFPARGSPGSSEWEAMAPADQDAVNRVAANVGKALEAYLRKLAAGPSALDRYLAGDAAALGEQERKGLRVFVQAGCSSCHSGPQLSDERYHNLGVPALAGAPLDEGRSAGLAHAGASPFNALGPYADGPVPGASGADYVAQPGAEALGAFRTPSLRNLEDSAPYGHNGRFATLEEVVDFHLQGGGRGAGGFVGEVSPLLQPRTLSADEREALLAFLRSLEGQYPAAPWNNWPEG
ncbi:cytochrome-c peroxidase [Aggregicoccus sp. 17bor-14]|uniref:cytochrome-c peroxidase n=1 Tax=Myxococcaceae TaxID=31 RepID=UPI00129CF52E|nr:cytochrome-c peroxidase [Simulacricoccus sp. 17bor-14]MRI88373.1 cytochrome-c peroxidase [Aggregicoccus sp. 17bor-14]